MAIPDGFRKYLYTMTTEQSNRHFLKVNDRIVVIPPFREPDKFDPQAIELLAVVNNPMLRMIKSDEGVSHTSELRAVCNLF